MIKVLKWSVFLVILMSIFQKEKKKDKITHAHAYGGTEATIETVEELFDIPVDYFFKLNFNAFIDVVDALGGITVDVPITFLKWIVTTRQNAIHLRKRISRN